ncbi:pilus assembly protein TadE [Halalkalibacillus sediminis]|uniref:Pilus assembly protein TadE n=1 Tax=Halalkalibacillus sediminis TaxID=2018042 RepID=A0A2I0QSH8_9BACI|nr:TadE/TadG family type IV pilus assembly protein [Halalkalibacillus sediminis]PKR77269.1 pilus assembly protein TadE [Halalkalibacillus sediminis]
MRLRRDQKGQSIVEFSLIIPLLMIILVGVFDVGRMMYSYTGLHFTAQETVRLGGFGYQDSEIVEFAHNNFQTGDSDKLEVSVSPDDASRKSGEYVTVTLTYPVEPFTPFAKQIFDGAVQLTADSTIRVE